MPDNQLAAENGARPPGMGHNLPPVTELIGDLGPRIEEWCAEVLEPHRPRVDELLATIKTAVIVDEASAAKVADLIQMLRATELHLEEERSAMKRPIIDAGRAIDSAFFRLRRPLELAREGNDGRGGLRGMLTAYEHRRETEAAAERARQETEARRLQMLAEAARRTAEQDHTLLSEEAAELAQEAAEAAERRAATIRPEPIRSHLGTVGQRREIGFGITDLGKCVRWMSAGSNPLRSHLEQAVRTILGKHLRGLGVAAVEAGVEIPGISTAVVTQAQVRR